MLNKVKPPLTLEANILETVLKYFTQIVRGEVLFETTIILETKIILKRGIKQDDIKDSVLN